jgi:HEPN domain-containing protein
MRRGVEAWWRAAREDLEMAELAVTNARFAPTAFHGQQAAEKVLRALLLAHHVEAREHSLLELLDMVRSQARLEPPEAILLAARRLEPHYIQARYPGPRGPAPADLYDQTIARELLTCSQEIFRWVEPQLGA